MAVVRTDDSRFKDLPDFPYDPHYVDVPAGFQEEHLRMHYLDEGPADANECVVCFHGQPTWSFLYRKVIPPLVRAGVRVLAPDFIGFGRSDKPVHRERFTYDAHVAWVTAWVDAVCVRSEGEGEGEGEGYGEGKGKGEGEGEGEGKGEGEGEGKGEGRPNPSLRSKRCTYTLLCQDWGGLIGLRVVAARPDVFGRIVAANTDLPTGPIPRVFSKPFRAGYELMPAPSFEQVGRAFRGRYRPSMCTLLKMLLLGQPPPPEQMLPFFWWIRHCDRYPDMLPHVCVGAPSRKGRISEEALRGYAAPFPEGDEKFLAGPRRFPVLVPILPDGGIYGDSQDVVKNLAAWEVLKAWHKPFLTAFSDKDPIFTPLKSHKKFQKLVPGARGIEHPTIEGAGHFLQEEEPEQLAQAVLRFIQSTPPK